MVKSQQSAETVPDSLQKIHNSGSFHVIYWQKEVMPDVDGVQSERTAADGGSGSGAGYLYGAESSRYSIWV